MSVAKKSSAGAIGSTQCPICFEQQLELRVLDCKHSFCQTCLLAIKDRGNSEESETGIICPVCREVTDLNSKDGSIGSLQTKYYGALPCGFCQEAKGVEDLWWCSKCIHIMCSRCTYAVHRQMKDHPELEPWDSLAALKTSCSFLKSYKPKKPAEEKVETENLLDENTVRETLADYFDEVTQHILEGLPNINEPIQDPETNESLLAQAIQAVFGLGSLEDLSQDTETTDTCSLEEAKNKYLKIASSALSLANIPFSLEEKAPPQHPDPVQPWSSVLESICQVPVEEMANLILARASDPAINSATTPSAPSMSDLLIEEEDSDILGSPTPSETDEQFSTHCEKTEVTFGLGPEEERSGASTSYSGRPSWITIGDENFDRDKVELVLRKDYILAFTPNKLQGWKWKMVQNSKSSSDTKNQIGIKLISKPFGLTKEANDHIMAADVANNGTVMVLIESVKQGVNLHQWENYWRKTPWIYHDLMAVSETALVTAKKGSGSVIYQNFSSGAITKKDEATINGIDLQVTRLALWKSRLAVMHKNEKIFIRDLSRGFKVGFLHPWDVIDCQKDMFVTQVCSPTLSMPLHQFQWMGQGTKLLIKNAQGIIRLNPDNKKEGMWLSFSEDGATNSDPGRSTASSENGSLPNNGQSSDQKANVSASEYNQSSQTATSAVASKFSRIRDPLSVVCRVTPSAFGGTVGLVKFGNGDLFPIAEYRASNSK